MGGPSGCGVRGVSLSLWLFLSLSPDFCHIHLAWDTPMYEVFLLFPHCFLVILSSHLSSHPMFQFSIIDTHRLSCSLCHNNNNNLYCSITAIHIMLKSCQYSFHFCFIILLHIYPRSSLPSYFLSVRPAAQSSYVFLSFSSFSILYTPFFLSSNFLPSQLLSFFPHFFFHVFFPFPLTRPSFLPSVRPCPPLPSLPSSSSSSIRRPSFVMAHVSLSLLFFTSLTWPGPHTYTHGPAGHIRTTTPYTHVGSTLEQYPTKDCGRQAGIIQRKGGEGGVSPVNPP